VKVATRKTAVVVRRSTAPATPTLEARFAESERAIDHLNTEADDLWRAVWKLGMALSGVSENVAVQHEALTHCVDIVDLVPERIREENGGGAA
jgi:hypothetical protein